MKTNFGTEIAITGFVWTIATRQLVMEGVWVVSEQNVYRYCRYRATKERCHGNHFVFLYMGCTLAPPG